MGLEASGFDVAGVLRIEAYDAAVPAGWRAATLLPEARSAMLLGASGRAFAAAFAASPEAADGDENPIDRFTARRVGAAVLEQDARGQPTRAFFYWEQRGGAFADFVALGRACGLGAVGRLGVLLHPRLGPWIALRALLLTGASLEATPALEDFGPCRRCPAPCAQACPVAAPGPSRFDIEACVAETRVRRSCREFCSARRACVIGPEHAYAPDLEARFRAAVVRALGRAD